MGKKFIEYKKRQKQQSTSRNKRMAEEDMELQMALEASLADQQATGSQPQSNLNHNQPQQPPAGQQNQQNMGNSHPQTSNNTAGARSSWTGAIPKTGNRSR